MSIKPEFILERQGRRFATFAGLADLAHSEEFGISACKTSVLQVGLEENGWQWVIHCTVTTKNGAFDGIGDASPGNVREQMKTMLPRLAETRAIVRALRFALNVVALVSDEEMPGDDAAPDERPHYGARAEERLQPPQQQQQRPVQQTQQARPVQQQPAASYQAGLATQPQVRAIYAIGRDQFKLTEQEIDQRSVDLFGASPSEITKLQASQFIESLKAGGTKAR